MKICIYGAGAIGTVLGAFLTKAGIDVDLVTRNQSHILSLKKNGAKIIGTVNFEVPVRALLPSEMKDKYDWIFLMTKQQDNDKVIDYLKTYMNEDCYICTFQNGLPEIKIAEKIGSERTFGAAVAWGATLHGNGVSKLTSEKDSLTFSIGTLGKNNKERLKELKLILDKMGPAEIEENFIGARWSKLLVNSAFSGMSTVLGCTFGETMRKESRKYVQRIIKECIDVAKKAKIKIAPIQGKDIVKLFDYNNPLKELFGYMILPLAIKKHKNLRASMLQDIKNNKKTEIDYINGVICEYGKKHNVDTPYNSMVVSIVHKIENGELTPSFENLKFFKGIK
jgi:2-dehydropantoate 2-reductase